MDRRYVGPKEMAEYLNLKTDTIYSWVWQRKIPHFKMGRCIRFDLREIEKWARERYVAEIR